MTLGELKSAFPNNPDLAYAVTVIHASGKQYYVFWETVLIALDDNDDGACVIGWFIAPPRTGRRWRYLDPKNLTVQ